MHKNPTGPDEIRETLADADDEPRANGHSADTRGSWREQLLLTEKQKPKPLLANAITAFRDAPEWRALLGFDTFSQKTILRGKAPWMQDTPGDQEWSFDVLAANWLQHQNINVSPDVTAQAVDAVARDRRFHPVQDYLARCKWDGEHRLDTWTMRYLGAEDTPYARAVGSRWMISGVARVSVPGCKADCAIILEGPQGALKSSALKVLAQPWFTDEIADLGTKDSAIQLAGAWCSSWPSSTVCRAATWQKSKPLCRARPTASGPLTAAAGYP